MQQIFMLGLAMVLIFTLEISTVRIRMYTLR